MVAALAIFFYAFVFFYGSIIHIADPASMRDAIGNFQLVNESWALVGAYLIPWLEFWFAAALLSRHTRQAGALGLFSLVVLFTIAMFIAWTRGIQLHCGCFGVMPQADDYGWLFVRNGALLLIGGYIFCCGLPPKKC